MEKKKDAVAGADATPGLLPHRLLFFLVVRRLMIRVLGWPPAAGLSFLLALALSLSLFSIDSQSAMARYRLRRGKWASIYSYFVSYRAIRRRRWGNPTNISARASRRKDLPPLI